ncbi:uncharacterized protein [Euphorbia lathyris]|uniref:uncharacterized protein n=1 Tax=Euphorbia lathyris TaxID=212925 RepID=UPI003313DCBB
MNLQDSLRLSSSRRSHRDASPARQNVHSKSIGCMSTIFQFLSKHNHRRRFLISGKKQEKESSNNFQPNSSSSDSPPRGGTATKNPRVSTCDVVLRSPTLPENMRSVYAFPPSPENYFHNQPALVARLMGLNEVPMIPGVKLSVAEKRRRLLGALEKCDEDLKALKKMIQVLTSVGDNNCKVACREKEESEPEEASCGVSTNSMVAEFTRSAWSVNTASNGGGLQQLKKRPGEEDNINISILDRIYTKEKKNDEKLFGLGIWGTKVMEETVKEVCRDIEWGQKREIRRIGMALQDFIFRDLIEDIVKDFRFSCINYHPDPPPLPLESCKRRLCF